MTTMFAAYCVEERWFSVAPGDWPAGRMLERRELSRLIAKRPASAYLAGHPQIPL